MVLELPLPENHWGGPDRVVDARASLDYLHANCLPSVAISRDSRLLAIGRNEGSLHVFDLKSARLLGTVRRHFGPVYTVTFSPDGKRIATGGNDGAVVLWETESLDPVGKLVGHRSYIKSLAFRPDGKQLATASGDGTVRLWDAERVRPRRAKLDEAARVTDRVQGRVTAELERGSLADVADSIREDRTLTDAERTAALQMVLRASAERARAAK